MTIQLTQLTEKQQKAVIAKAAAQDFLKDAGHDPELWRNVELMDKKAKVAGGNGSYNYSRYAVKVDCIYWENNDRPVIVFSAPYSGELPIWECFIETHSVYYYVNEDFSLQWANEDGSNE